MDRIAEADHPDTVRVLIVDDHDLFRVGMASLLSSEPDFEVVGQASGGRMGVRLARELRPDVILMDLSMPDIDGDEATRLVTEQRPDARVVMLTVAADEASVAGAVQAGACGYLVKDSPIDEVVGAVRAAHRGSAWISPRAAEALLDKVRREKVAPAPDSAALASLTARELEVLQLLARGAENSDIAQELFISPRTAKNHVSSILAKLELANRVQAAVFAAEHHLN